MLTAFNSYHGMFAPAENEILQGSKKDQTLTFDSTGVLKLHKQSRVEPCSTATEIQVRYCLTRRALALEQANVVSFKNMESWSEKMMSLLRTISKPL